MTSAPGQLMRIHIGEDDTWQGRPLYQEIVDRCRQAGASGATVYRAIEGYGGGSFIRRPHFLHSADLPIVVTIIDSAEKLAELRPLLDEIVDEGLIALSAVEVLRPALG